MDEIKKQNQCMHITQNENTVSNQHPNTTNMGYKIAKKIIYSTTLDDRQVALISHRVYTSNHTQYLYDYYTCICGKYMILCGNLPFVSINNIAAVDLKLLSFSMRLSLPLAVPLFTKSRSLSFSVQCTVYTQNVNGIVQCLLLSMPHFKWFLFFSTDPPSYVR